SGNTAGVDDREHTMLVIVQKRLQCLSIQQLLARPADRVVKIRNSAAVREHDVAQKPGRVVLVPDQKTLAARCSSVAIGIVLKLPRTEFEYAVCGIVLRSLVSRREAVAVRIVGETSERLSFAA